jgi:hypothetical protein
MTGTQEDISSMISLIKLVENKPYLRNFTLKIYSRTDLTSLAWRKIAAEFKDTGKEVWGRYPHKLMFGCRWYALLLARSVNTQLALCGA